MDTFAQLISYVGLVILALVPIANPFSTAPLFISMTVNKTADERRKIAMHACIYMFGVLTVFLLLGTVILNLFGISLPALRIAGGLVVAFIGFRMLFPTQYAVERGEVVKGQNIAFTPLAMPMLSGPGSISVVMSMAAQVPDFGGTKDQIIAYSVICLGILISSIICWLVIRASGTVIKFMGEAGIDALSKVMGFLLVCIGVEFLVAGFIGLEVVIN